MIGFLFARKEVYVVFGIAAVITGVLFLAHYSQRAEKLSRAILEGREERAIEMLIARPELLNQPDKSNGFTPLHWAVIADRTNLVYWLLEKGANVNAADPAGMTPLHKAAAFNRVTCAEMLVAKGAKVSAVARKYGTLYLAPIHLAAEEGKADMVACLLKNGVDANFFTDGANYVTPLHMAAAQGRTSVVEVLIAAGADVNIQDCACKTPLTWAIQSGQDGVADMLRQAGAVQ